MIHILPRLTYLDGYSLSDALEKRNNFCFGDAPSDCLSPDEIDRKLIHLESSHRHMFRLLSLFADAVDIDVFDKVLRACEPVDLERGVARDKCRVFLEACVDANLATVVNRDCYRFKRGVSRHALLSWRRAEEETFPEIWGSIQEVAVSAYVACLSQVPEIVTSMFRFAAQKRTIGTMVYRALDQGRYREAKGLLEPLEAAWSRGRLLDEAWDWFYRCESFLLGPEGAQPSLGTPAGSLWLYMLRRQAERCEDAGALEEAIDLQRRVVFMLRSSDQPDALPLLVEACYRMSQLFEACGLLAESARWIEGLLDLCRAQGDFGMLSRAYRELGVLAHLRGELQQAELWHHKALRICEIMKHRAGVAVTYYELGLVARDRGDLEASDLWFRRSITVGKSFGDLGGVADCLREMEINGDVRREAASVTSRDRLSLKRVQKGRGVSAVAPKIEDPEDSDSVRPGRARERTFLSSWGSGGENSDE